MYRNYTHTHRIRTQCWTCPLGEGASSTSVSTRCDYYCYHCYYCVPRVCKYNIIARFCSNNVYDGLHPRRNERQQHVYCVRAYVCRVLHVLRSIYFTCICNNNIPLVRNSIWPYNNARITRHGIPCWGCARVFPRRPFSCIKNHNNQTNDDLLVFSRLLVVRTLHPHRVPRTLFAYACTLPSITRAHPFPRPDPELFDAIKHTGVYRSLLQARKFCAWFVAEYN